MQGSLTTAMPEHRRGALTPEMAPRRRNPKGGRHFAGARWSGTKQRVASPWNGRAGCKVPDTTPASIFQQYLTGCADPEE